MRIRMLVTMAVALTMAVGTAPSRAGRGAPETERTVLYWMPDYQLLPLRISAETWRASGVSALLTPSFGFEVMNGTLTDERIQSHLDEVTQAAAGMPVYLGVVLSHQADNPRGGEIPYPWSDGEQWLRLEDNLRRLAAECERRGVRGILLDGEGYGQSPGHPFGYQDPLYCYRAPGRGERGLPRKRGAEVARALRAGGPSLTLGTYFGHYQEQGTPSCRPFWRGFFNAAGRNALYIYEDSYGAFPDFRYARFSQAMRSYYQCPRAVPSWWAATGAADVPGWFRRALPQLQRAMAISGMLMVYQDQQMGAEPGEFFSADPVWSSALSEVLREVNRPTLKDSGSVARREATGNPALICGAFRKNAELRRRRTRAWPTARRALAARLGRSPARRAALLQLPQCGNTREVYRQALLQTQDPEDPVNARIPAGHQDAAAAVSLRRFDQRDEKPHAPAVNELDAFQLNNYPFRLLLQSPAAGLRNGVDGGCVQIFTQRDDDKPLPFLHLDTEHWGPLMSSLR